MEGVSTGRHIPDEFIGLEPPLDGRGKLASTLADPLEPRLPTRFGLPFPQGSRLVVPVLHRVESME